jgi:hypothetical protein
MRKGFLLGPASKPTEDTKPAGSAEADKKLAALAEKNEAAVKKVAEVAAAAATQPTPEKVKSFFLRKNCLIFVNIGTTSTAVSGYYKS